MIEFKSDGGDFAEVWVDGKLVLDMNKDEYDIDTALAAISAVAHALGIKVIRKKM